MHDGLRQNKDQPFRRCVLYSIHKICIHIVLFLDPNPHKEKGLVNFGPSLAFILWHVPTRPCLDLIGLWSVWLHRRLVVMQSWDLIGQHDYICNLAYTASIAMLHPCGKLVIWQCQSCDLTIVHGNSAGPRIWPKFTRSLFLLGGEVWAWDWYTHT